MGYALGPAQADARRSVARGHTRNPTSSLAIAERANVRMDAGKYTSGVGIPSGVPSTAASAATASAAAAATAAAAAFGWAASPPAPTTAPVLLVVFFHHSQARRRACLLLEERKTPKTGKSRRKDRKCGKVWREGDKSGTSPPAEEGIGPAGPRGRQETRRPQAGNPRRMFATLAESPLQALQRAAALVKAAQHTKNHASGEQKMAQVLDLLKGIQGGGNLLAAPPLAKHKQSAARSLAAPRKDGAGSGLDLVAILRGAAPV